MSTIDNRSLDDEEWSLVRDHQENKNGHEVKKYEAIAISDASEDHEYLDDEVVMIKETSAFGGDKRHIIPQDVVKKIARRIR